MDIHYTQCDICHQRILGDPYKLHVEPQDTIHCKYQSNEIDICEDCLELLCSTALARGDHTVIKCNKLLKPKE